MIGSESPCERGPCQRCTSVPQSVDAVIMINNEPGSRSGMGTRSMVRGLLCSVITAARHVSITASSTERLKCLNFFLQRQFVKCLSIAPQHSRLVVVADFVAFQKLSDIVLAAFVSA